VSLIRPCEMVHALLAGMPNPISIL